MCVCGARISTKMRLCVTDFPTNRLEQEELKERTKKIDELIWGA